MIWPIAVLAVASGFTRLSFVALDGRDKWLLESYGPALRPVTRVPYSLADSGNIVSGLLVLVDTGRSLAVFDGNTKALHHIDGTSSSMVGSLSPDGNSVTTFDPMRGNLTVFRWQKKAYRKVRSVAIDVKAVTRLVVSDTEDVVVQAGAHVRLITWGGAVFLFRSDDPIRQIRNEMLLSSDRWVKLSSGAYEVRRCADSDNIVGWGRAGELVRVRSSWNWFAPPSQEILVGSLSRAQTEPAREVPYPLKLLTRFVPSGVGASR